MKNSFLVSIFVVVLIFFFGCDNSTGPEGISTWKNQDSNVSTNLNGIWGLSENLVYAVGDNGTIIKYNGTSWSAENSVTTVNLLSIYGTGANNIYVIGENGLVLSYDGTSWQELDVVATGFDPNLYDFKGTWNLRDKVHPVVKEKIELTIKVNASKMEVFDGNSWETMILPSNKYMFDVWGDGVWNIYVACAMGVILHYDGLSWTDNVYERITMQHLKAIDGLRNDYIMAVGEGGSILYYNGNDWSTMQSNTNENLNDVWISESGSAWIVGDNGVILSN